MSLRGKKYLENMRLYGFPPWKRIDTSVQQNIILAYNQVQYDTVTLVVLLQYIYPSPSHYRHLSASYLSSHCYIYPNTAIYPLYRLCYLSWYCLYHANSTKIQE